MKSRPILPILLTCSALATAGLGAASCDGGGGGGAKEDSQAVLAIIIHGSIGLNLEFPAISAGGTYSDKVDIKSIGKGDLIVTTAEFVRTDGGAAQTLTMLPVSLPMTLSPDRTGSIEFLYSPTAGQPAPSGTLTIDSNDLISGPQQVTVGTQIRQGDIKVEPPNLSWDDVTVMDNQPDCGQASPDLKKAFNVINTGQDFLQITEYELDPASKQRHFTVCPAPFEGERNVIPQGASREWKVVFHPQDEGDQTAFLKIHTSNGKQAQVTLRGGSQGGGGVVVTPTVLAWPSLGEDNCGEQNFQICNTGDLPLAIPQIKMEPTGVEDFYTLSGDLYDRGARKLRETIPAGECTGLTVLYCTEDELVEGIIEVHHTAFPLVPSPIIVELKGQSQLPQLCVDPINLVFSGTAEDEEVSRSLVVHNCGGGVLETEVTEIVQFGAGSFGHENFRFTTNPRLASIEAGQFEVVTVTYTRPPGQVGKDRGNLLLAHNDTFIGATDNPLAIGLLTDHETPNLPPVARQTCDPSCTLQAGQTVTLDCSTSSDDDAGEREPAIGRCEWRIIQRPEGSEARPRPPSVNLTKDPPDAPSTEITLDVPGTYKVELFVTESGQGGMISAPAPPIEIFATVPE